jgi:hypothetical protein
MRLKKTPTTFGLLDVHPSSREKENGGNACFVDGFPELTVVLGSKEMYRILQS